MLRGRGGGDYVPSCITMDNRAGGLRVTDVLVHLSSYADLRKLSHSTQVDVARHTLPNDTDAVHKLVSLDVVPT